MRVDRGPLFDEESARFELRFCCEDCGHFDAGLAACRHFWPTESHKKQPAASEPRPLLDFCKEFELC